MEQIVKFGIIGIIATLVDWILYAILVEMYGVTSLAAMGITLKSWKKKSTIISFSISLILNYICSMKYVFERREDMSRTREFVIFLVLSIIGLRINVLIIDLLDGVEQWFENWPALIYHFAYMVPKVVATAVVLVWNFVTRKIFLEQKREKKER